MRDGPSSSVSHRRRIAPDSFLWGSGGLSRASASPLSPGPSHTGENSEQRKSGERLRFTRIRYQTFGRGSEGVSPMVE
jgi:hypothetical protein